MTPDEEFLLDCLAEGVPLSDAAAHLIDREHAAGRLPEDEFEIAFLDYMAIARRIEQAVSV